MVREYIFYALLFLFIPASVNAVNQTDNLAKEDYANYLLKDKDYFRAAGEFKRLAYYSSNDTLRLKYLLLTARCERWAGQYDFAKKYSGHVEIYAENFPIFQDNARIEISMNALSDGNLLLSKLKLESISYNNSEVFNYSRSLLAGISMWQRDFSGSGNYIRSLKKEGSNYQNCFDRLSTINDSAQQQKLKSPALASVLSGIIPGSGQFYSEHPVDGIQVLVMTGIFGFFSAVAWQHDMDKYDNPSAMFAVSASITSIFYAANIMGANKTARYRNARIRLDALDAVIKEVDYLLKADAIEGK